MGAPLYHLSEQSPNYSCLSSSRVMLQFFLILRHNEGPEYHWDLPLRDPLIIRVITDISTPTVTTDSLFSV